MTDFTLHTHDTAHDDAKPLLKASEKAFGMIPNLHAVMAESPETLEAYQKLGELFQKSSLTAIEKNVIWLTINVEHECHYCVPAHSAIAMMQGVDAETVNALRSAAPLDDPKLEALRTFTLQAVRQRGVVDVADTQAFLAAGFTKRNILDVILGVSHKVLSNYVNHFAQTPVDPPFKDHAWTPSARAAAE